MFLPGKPRQRRLACRLARAVAEFAPPLIGIFSDYTKETEIDFDQFSGCEAVISETGIRRRESHP
jgi:hypothetical protein